ncbi:hypothetical protein GCM10018793_44380 [Streptomyces sulfonofaciens]|uniref:Uncharacterized protein n=1 Tax=Streptomyces sulfonofaciens TaxID=68272 RepID=A0A919L322_9ACTN|nr:hypothetical protein GCM10018793_44380 [Streptomyces sulfonofaciens]
MALVPSCGGPPPFAEMVQRFDRADGWDGTRPPSVPDGSDGALRGAECDPLVRRSASVEDGVRPRSHGSAAMDRGAARGAWVRRRRSAGRRGADRLSPEPRGPVGTWPGLVVCMPP